LESGSILGGTCKGDEWTETDVQGKKIFALRVKDDSMEPEFVEGDVIVVNPNIEVNPGDFVVVESEGEEASFKQLKEYGETLVLHSLNPKYADIEIKEGYNYRILGRVVKKEKRY
jgi:SOS-response transcriptional repressor LexA